MNKPLLLSFLIIIMLFFMYSCYQCSENRECRDFPNPLKFCNKGTGNCDGHGTCQARTDPQSEPCTWDDPVCGCDGKTYNNLCLAHAVGVNVLYYGECLEGEGTCTDNSDCPSDDLYCKKSLGDCEGEGNCEGKPLQCYFVYNPVCGCDGITYSNDCVAATSGINVSYWGECD